MHVNVTSSPAEKQKKRVEGIDERGRQRKELQHAKYARKKIDYSVRNEVTTRALREHWEKEGTVEKMGLQRLSKNSQSQLSELHQIVYGIPEETGKPRLLSVCRFRVNPAGNRRSRSRRIPDAEMTMNQHVSKIAAASFFHLRRLRQIRRRVGTEVTIRLVLALITSRLDYCNSLLAGAPQSTLGVLQRVQNVAARLIFELGPRDHVTDSLIQLHWLPIRWRVRRTASTHQVQ